MTPKALQFNISITLTDETLAQLQRIAAQVLGQISRPLPSAPPSPGKPNESVFLNMRETAKLLGLSERTIWSKSQTGEIPKPKRIGRSVRWSAEELKKWAAGRS